MKRNRRPAQALGLPASASGRDLVAVGPPAQGDADAVDVEERLTLPALGAAGTMEARVSVTGRRGDMMRFVWGRARPDERRQVSLSDYERRYPGIELASDPQALDDPERNRFTIVSRYRLPRLAQADDGDWAVAFSPWNVVGAFNLPASLQRRFPLAVADFPMQRRYRVVVEWPQQVSGTLGPRSEVLDGLVFRAESRSTFRGNRSEYSLNLRTKASDVAVDALPRLMDDLRALARMAENGVVARRRDIAAEVLYRSGDFQKADAAFTRALLLGADAADALSARGMARHDMGRFDEAAADFAKAAAAATGTEDALYTRLWQTWSTQRAGMPLPADLLELARREPRGAWPRPALALLVGDLTPQAMLAEVDRLQGDERELALAEAWFYAGQHHLLQGRTAEARAAFETCRAAGITAYNGHMGAGFELAGLAAPPAAGGVPAPKP